MAHQEGWMEAYKLLDEGNDIPSDLLNIIKKNKTGIGETFLHWYAIEGELKVVEKIINLGFDVNTQNEFGNTPLMECALIEKWGMVKLLLSKGADPEIKDSNGENAIESLRDEYEDVEKSNKLSELINSNKAINK